MLLPQIIVGRHFLLYFHKEWSDVSFAKGDKLGNIEALLLIIQAGLIMAAAESPGHFTQRP